MCKRQVEQIARLIYPESRALVDAHLDKGHTVSVISSATPYQVEPAARYLGIEHVMCTYLETEGGKFTCGVAKTTCSSHGHVTAAYVLSLPPRHLSRRATHTHRRLCTRISMNIPCANSSGTPDNAFAWVANNGQ